MKKKSHTGQSLNLLVKSSQETSHSPRLTIQELETVVPVQISQKLQDQVSYLCKEVWNDEWSGMLFYETEGEFGQDNFKVIAQELFPLDIGTQTYTEYETSDPELIKFLMSNPQVRSMKKGHIHSHNNMGVFFSNTDNEELTDNCGFHNFYLSLIVNNKNEMCAKIAFKATIKSVVDSTITYKNQDGIDTEKKMSSEKNSESIFAYKCKVYTPQGGAVEDTFKSRFQELRTNKNKKEETKKASEAANKFKHQQGMYSSSRGLFDDAEEKTGSFKGKENSSSDGRLGVVARNLKPIDQKVYKMLSKILSQDPTYNGTVISILEQLDSKFYDFEGMLPSQSEVASMYFGMVEDSAIDFYFKLFPEDHSLMKFDSVMEDCVKILKNYRLRFPDLVDELINALNIEIK